MTATRKALPAPLYAIVDAGACAAAGYEVVDFARLLLDEGVRFLQLRGKDVGSRDLLRWSDQLARHLDAVPGARLVVNDRVDVALAAGLPHVHVGQDDLAPHDARTLVGPAGTIGLSTHTPAQIAAACAAPIDYLAVGPVYGTPTKATGHHPVGLDLVRHAAGQARLAGRLPVVAIGGITAERAAAVIEAGADAVAVIGGLLAGGHPVAAVRRYRHALGGW